MFKATFSSSQLEARTQVYIKYQNELQNADEKEAGAIEKIRSLVKPLEFLWQKSGKAKQKVAKEEKKARNRMYDKATQVCDLFDMDPIVTSACDKFDGELKKARSTFKRMMRKAEDKFFCEIGDLWGEVLDKINDCTTSYKYRVKEAWHTFKDNVMKRMDIEYAAKRFETKVVRAREDFEAGIKSTTENFGAKTKSVRKDFLKGTFNPAIVEHDTAVNQAVEEYFWRVSSAFQYFCLNIDQIVQDGKIVKTGRLQPPKYPENPSLSLDSKMETKDEVENLAEESLKKAMEKKKIAQEEEQQLVKHSAMEKNAENPKEAAQRLADLELKMSEMLSTMAENKSRLICPCEKQ